MLNTHCDVCKGSCPTIVLNKKAPSSVLNLFKSAPGQLKSIFKTISWQESQKQSIMQATELEVQKLEETARQQESELARLEQALAEKRTEVNDLKEKEVVFKSKISSLCRGKAVGSLKKDSSKEGDVVPNVSSAKPSWKGSSHGQGQGSSLGPQGARPLSSAFYKGMATGSSTSYNMTEKGDSSRCFTFLVIQLLQYQSMQGRFSQQQQQQP